MTSHICSHHTTGRGQSHRNPPGAPHATRSGSPPRFPEANVPGRQGPVNGEHSGPPPYYAIRGDAAYYAWNGVGHGDPYLPVQGPMSPRLQPGMGHGMGPPQSSVIRSPRPEFRQPYPSPFQPPSVTHPLHSSSFAHQQSPGPMIATGSQSQGSAGVPNVWGGTYYPEQWSSMQAASSSRAATTSQLPVSPRPFDLTSGYLAYQMPVPRQPSFRFPPGKRKALIIGINYTWHQDPLMQLRCCIEDAYWMANFLHDQLGFAREDIRIMTDDRYGTPYFPNKGNILREMRALVHDPQPHDSFFLYYSGHAVQIQDLDGDESDGFDECICAIDYPGNGQIPDPNPDTPGLIVDDVMHEIMVKPLPKQCRLTAIFDSCHSGTLLDLPFRYDVNGRVREFVHPNRLDVLRQKMSYADVVSLSACKDSENALETDRGGALRHAFMHCMTEFNNQVTYQQLILNVREYMKKYKFPQRPQARIISDIAPLSSLLILTNIYSYQALMRLIQIPRSSSNLKEAIGELDANPPIIP